MNFLGMVFTNPAVIAGALGLFVPYIVHLLTRKTPRRIVFPTIRFVKKAEASQSSIFKLRHLLLLLLRTAFVCLLLLAFLKPVFQPHALVSAGTNAGQRAAIVVLDCSASMGYSGQGFSPMTRARTAAEEVLDQLGSADVANVIFAEAQPRTSIDQPASNRFNLKRDVAAAKATLDRADIEGALAEAIQQLTKTGAPLKEIHLISDFQRSNWAAVDFSAVPPEVSVVFIPATPEMAENVAIAEVSLYPPIPAASEEVEVTCRIANYTASPQEIPVRLAFGSDEPLEKTVSLQPNFSGAATFRIRARTPGQFEGVVSIPEHGLQADDERFFTLNVTNRLEVAVMSNTPPTVETGSTRFLMRAIDPFAGADSNGAARQGAFGARYYDRNSMANLMGNQPQVLIFDKAPALSGQAIDHLYQYLSGGGAVVYFLSQPQDKTNLEALQAASNGALTLPFTMAGVRSYENADDAEFASIGGANFDEPMLRKFRDSGELINIQVYRHFDTQAASAGTASLMRYSDGGIAMAQASVGTGRLLLCNFSPALDASDLAKRAVFVPLLHELMKGARGAEGVARSFTVGAGASTTVPMTGATADVHFSDPRGEFVNAGFDRVGSEASVIFPATDQTGFYRVHSGGEQIGSVGVNLDERESNLEALTIDQLEQLTRLSRDRLFAADDAQLTDLREFTQGRPIWHYFLLAAIAAIAMEQGLLLYLRR